MLLDALKIFFPEETLTQLILIASLPGLGKLYCNKLTNLSRINNSNVNNFARLNRTCLIYLIRLEQSIHIYIFYFIIFSKIKIESLLSSSHILVY